MATQHNPSAESSNLSPAVSDDYSEGGTASQPTALEEHRQTQTRIRLRIPKTYHQEPVISRLVSEHGVTVNIAAALLGANARDDGWFDLDLRGTAPQLDSALLYLNELDLEIWQDSAGAQQDGW